MKKVTAILLTFSLCLSMTACSEKSSPEITSQETGNSNAAESTPATLELAGEVTGEITVSCYDSFTYQGFLEEAARLFEEKYPGTTVKVESFSAMPEIKTSEDGNTKVTIVQAEADPGGQADYISRINTSLMSGEGADILAMDILPVQKYIKSGQLENLKAYMESDAEFNSSDYRENILKAITYEGGTWFLPADYSFTYYTYDSTLLPETDTANFGTGNSVTAEQLVTIAAPSFQGTEKMFNTPNYSKNFGSDMFNQLLAENYKSFVDLENQRANFNDGNFEQLLNSVQEYAELGYIPQGTTGQTDAKAMMKKMGEAPTNRYYFKPQINFSLIQQFNRDSGRNMVFSNGTDTGIEKDDLIAGIQADRSGNVPFEYGQAYGMNANSRNKQTAWAFLKFLLSEEMQISTNLSMASLPLNNAARKEKAELVVSGAFWGMGEELDDSQKEVLQQYTEAVEQLSDQINSYTITDAVISDMISEQVQYFFDNSKTASEVSDILQSKVGLYLSE